MPFEKGQSGNPNGRPTGATNKSSKQVREAINFVIEDNLSNLQIWINDIAKDDPKAAFNCIMQLLDYGLPKLQKEHLVEEKIYEKNSTRYDEILQAALEAVKNLDD